MQRVFVQIRKPAQASPPATLLRFPASSSSAEQRLLSRIEALNAALASFDAPKPPEGCFAFSYQHPDLGRIDCHLTHLPEEDGAPEDVELEAVYLRGAPFDQYLPYKDAEAIKDAALESCQHNRRRRTLACAA